jgi:dTDP-4-amino-4,6-dideoxygalactose transaminase
MKVPLVDLKGQYRKMRAEVRRAVDEVLDSQLFILGPAVKKFEEAAASYLKCSAAVGVASGSDALLLSLMALGIGPEDAVLVPPFTFFSTVSAITRLGAMPIFVDIDPQSFLMDPKETERVFEEHSRLQSRRRIKALLPVHLFGQCCPMTPFLALARTHHLHIVEDVAQAFGARALPADGASKAAGTVGGLGCYSFFPSKNLGGAGDGGLVATDRPDLAERVRTLRVHGASFKYHHQVVGLNSRLDSIQAAVLSVKLRYLDRWCDARIKCAGRYERLFSSTGLVGKEIISLPSPGKDNSHVFNLYVIRATKRDELKRFLSEQGVQTGVYYPLPLHLQPCFAFLEYRKGDFPHSELAASQVLALPLYPEISSNQQEFVVQKIADFYKR